MTSENNKPEPEKPKKRDVRNERLIVQEMVRLYEARLDVQLAEVVATERKAAMLGSLCLVLIGYLLASDAHTADAHTANCLKSITGEYCNFLVSAIVFSIEVVSSLLLAVGGAFCWVTLTPAAYRWKGSIAYIMDERLLTSDVTDLLKHLNGRYKKASDKNAKTIKETKRKNIKWAVRFSRLGVIFSFLSVFLAKALPVAFPIISAMIG